MECACGGALVEGRSCYRASTGQYLLLIEDIPAFQCSRCGKVLFRDETVEKIKKIENRLEREISEITSGKSSVHLYDY
jgi:YgiT-type zinc finger domain-containing protein